MLKGLPLILTLVLAAVLPARSATQPVSSGSLLSSLSLGGVTLSPDFSPTVTSYVAGVPNSTSTVAATPVVATTNATVTVNGGAVASGTASQSISLQTGANNIITIVVTAPDFSSSTTYTVQITRALSSTATLASLDISAGALSPTFTPNNLSYWATVQNVNSTVQFTPTCTDSGAVVTISGITVASGSPSFPVSLTVGMNSITISVTSENGSVTKNYQINVTRQPSSIATLDDLNLGDGWLSSQFSRDVVSYSAAVKNETSWLSVTATPTDDSATVKINGVQVGGEAYWVELDVGENIITVVVAAQDGVGLRAYTIKVTRAAPSDGKLYGLSVKNVAISPKFNPGTLSYTASVAKTKTAVQIRPLSKHKYDIITVNGKYVKSGVLSAPVRLKSGKNAIKVVVNSDGGPTKTYKITINRP